MRQRARKSRVFTPRKPPRIESPEAVSGGAGLAPVHVHPFVGVGRGEELGGSEEGGEGEEGECGHLRVSLSIWLLLSHPCHSQVFKKKWEAPLKAFADL